MARGTPALIQPSLLVWARDSAGLDIDEAAKKAHVKADSLRQWEQGETRYVTVLQIPPVDSPQTAVKVAVAKEIRDAREKAKGR